MNGVGHFGRYVFGGEAKFLGHDVDGLGIETLVDRYHHTEVHTCGDYLIDGHIHHDGEVVGGYKLGEFEYAAFG